MSEDPRIRDAAIRDAGDIVRAAQRTCSLRTHSLQVTATTRRVAAARATVPFLMIEYDLLRRGSEPGTGISG